MNFTNTDRVREEVDWLVFTDMHWRVDVQVRSQVYMLVDRQVRNQIIRMRNKIKEEIDK